MCRPSVAVCVLVAFFLVHCYPAPFIQQTRAQQTQKQQLDGAAGQQQQGENADKREADEEATTNVMNATETTTAAAEWGSSPSPVPLFDPDLEGPPCVPLKRRRTNSEGRERAVTAALSEEGAVLAKPSSWSSTAPSAEKNGTGNV